MNCLYTETNEKPKKYSQEIKDKLSKANTGKKHNEESKEKFRNYHKNRIVTEDWKLSMRKSNPYKKAILQFDLNDNFLNEFESLADAARSLGLNKNYVNISQVLRKKAKTAYNFKWKYKSESDFGKIINQKKIDYLK